MAWAGGGAAAPLAISATDTELAEVLADVAEVLADVAGASAAWCSEGALQPTAKNVKPIANTRIGVTLSRSKRESNPAARWFRRLLRAAGSQNLTVTISYGTSTSSVAGNGPTTTAMLASSNGGVGPSQQQPTSFAKRRSSMTWGIEERRLGRAPFQRFVDIARIAELDDAHRTGDRPRDRHKAEALLRSALD